MREIKFRAWDKDLDTMIWIGTNDPTDPNPLPTTEQDEKILDWKFIFEQDESMPLMQYTGFKTNGIDIYDGDILTNDGGWWYVEWSQDEGQWECHPILGGNVWTNLGEIVPSKETWVKGNIYQNPELLK